MVDPVELHLNKKLYLSIEGLIKKKLQDTGQDNRSIKGTLLFPKVNNMSIRIYKRLDTDPDININKNSSHGVDFIFTGLLNSR